MTWLNEDDVIKKNAGSRIKELNNQKVQLNSVKAVLQKPTTFTLPSTQEDIQKIEDKSIR